MARSVGTTVVPLPAQHDPGRHFGSASLGLIISLDTYGCNTAAEQAGMPAPALSSGQIACSRAFSAFNASVADC